VQQLASSTKYPSSQSEDVSCELDAALLWIALLCGSLDVLCGSLDVLLCDSLDAALCAPLDAALCAPLDAALCAPLDAALCAPLDAALCAPLDAALCGSLDAALCAPLDAALCAPLDAALCAPLDAALCAPLDAALCAPLDAALCAPLDAALCGSLDAALEGSHVKWRPYIAQNFPSQLSFEAHLSTTTRSPQLYVSILHRSTESHLAAWLQSLWRCRPILMVSGASREGTRRSHLPVVWLQRTVMHPSCPRHFASRYTHLWFGPHTPHSPPQSPLVMQQLLASMK
jgi:hypothetical protein